MLLIWIFIERAKQILRIVTRAQEMLSGHKGMWSSKVELTETGMGSAKHCACLIGSRDGVSLRCQSRHATCERSTTTFPVLPNIHARHGGNELCNRDRDS
jgi:hypothetical protein